MTHSKLKDAGAERRAGGRGLPPIGGSYCRQVGRIEKKGEAVRGLVHEEIAFVSATH